MKLKEYNDLVWQDQDEAFYEFCEYYNLDHTDPDSRKEFLSSLEADV